MFIVKCLPIVGTAVNGVEAVAALADGDGKRFASKLAQTGIGAVMDTAFVMSGGLSSLVTAPLTGSTIEGGKIVGKKLMSDMLVKEAGKFTTNVAVRAVTQYTIDKASGNNQLVKHQSSDDGGYPVQFRVIGKISDAAEALQKGDAKKFGFSLTQAATVAVECFTEETTNSKKRRRSGGGSGYSEEYGYSNGTGAGGNNDPPRGNPNLYKEHYDSEVRSGDPITNVVLGQNGRVEILEATIRKCHLKPRPKKNEPKRKRQKVTPRVERFIESLGQVRSELKVKKRKKHKGEKKDEEEEKRIHENDEIGHLVGDRLSGPHDVTYNFIPQSPNCNMRYYFDVECEIYEYLEERDQDDYVRLRVEMVYVDYIEGVSPDRPRALKVYLEYSDGKKHTLELSNM